MTAEKLTELLQSIAYRAKMGMRYGADMASSKDVCLEDCRAMALLALAVIDQAKDRTFAAEMAKIDACD